MIVWFEIPVINLDRAIKFYSAIFEDTIQLTDLLDEQYGIFSRKSGFNGCLVRKEDFRPGTGPVIYFKVIDINEVLDQVKKNGGRITIPKTLLRQKMKDGNLFISKTLIDDKVGYYANFIDSEGNKIGLYSNS